MKTILAVFKDDLKSIFSHFFVLVVAIGICVLPALYAWFNIYANWDPYANTGNIHLAAVIEDKGWTDEDGNEWNLGADIKESLSESDSIDWVFVDTDEEAADGVRSGEYYAAIVLDEDFSKNMFAGINETDSFPSLKYYVNDKKNAVATKVTDTAVASVQNSINEIYIATVTSRIFSDVQEEASVDEAETKVGEFIEKLDLVRSNLSDYSGMIDSLLASNEKLIAASDNAAAKLSDSREAIDAGSAKIAEGKADVENAANTFDSFSSNITAALSDAQSTISSMASKVSAAQLESDAEAVKDRLNELIPQAQELNDRLDALADAILSIDTEEITISEIADQIESIQNVIVILQTNATKTAAVTAAEGLSDSVHDSLQACADNIGTISAMFSSNLIPAVDQLIDSLSASMDSMQDILTNLSAAIGTVDGIFTNLDNTVNDLNSSMTELKGTLDTASEKLEDLIEKLKTAEYSQQLQMIVAFLSGDADAIGDYFAEPVSVEDNYLYEIENYGSGVAPFYTALAIWVGMTILVSVLKVHPKGKKYPDAKRHQLFFGRYLTFLLLSEIQTLIIAFGELYAFKIQCLYPGLFIAAAMAASLTMSLLIYTLVVSFGDIGKGIAIIALVIQIAGSGGTYPIEILPEFFRNVYVFFPFPYVINAMRECIGGMYENTYINCLIILGIFVAASLFLGLLVRLPLIPLNKFVARRLEDTKLM